MMTETHLRLGALLGPGVLLLVLLAALALGCAQADPVEDLPLISGGLNFRSAGPTPLRPVVARHPDPAGGQEGWCEVRMDIDPSGASRDHRVLDCEPRGLFEEASLSAARQLRYRQSEHGYRDVQYRIEF